MSASQPLVFYQSINLNKAGISLLSQIPGIGPKLAQRIIDYRSQHGAFNHLDELRKVHGIGPAKLARIRQYATVFPPAEI